MRSEANTPIEQRYLVLEGKASPAAVESVKAGLPSVKLNNAEIIFVQFAYADLPFTKRYDVVFPRGRPQDGVRCSCEVVAATQQFAKPSPDIPHGWKTICLIHFINGIPPLIQNLPVVDAWYESDRCVCICDELVWAHLNTCSAQ